MTLDQWADVFQIVGGAATALGVIIAIVAGLVALEQTRSQRQIHSEQEYADTFERYAGDRESLRRTMERSDFNTSDAAAFDETKTAFAQMIRYLRLLTDLARNAKGTVSSVDWLFFADDADFVSTSMRKIHAKVLISTNMKLVENALKGVQSGDDFNAKVQIESIANSVDNIKKECGEDWDTCALKIKALVSPNSKLLFDFQRKGRPEGPSREHMALLRYISLMLAEFGALENFIETRAEQVTDQAIDKDMRADAIARSSRGN